MKKPTISLAAAKIRRCPAQPSATGQTVLVANTSHATVTRQLADDTWSFSVPRFFDGGTVVGGTKEVDDLEPAPRPETRELLLRRFAETYPPILLGDGGDGDDVAATAAAAADGGVVSDELHALGRAPRGGSDVWQGSHGAENFRIIADIVGRRPTRQGGLRLEGQRLKIMAGVVVHAYGLGGRGYELSWGVADRVHGYLLLLN